jgi:uncharacterized protein with von Willebrand factor type A (vWA) domain
LHDALAGQQETLAALVVHQERLATRQDELAARQEDLASSTLAAVQELLSALERERAGTPQESAESLERYREQLAAQQQELAALARHEERIADQLKTAAGVSASAEARQDFFLTRIEQVTHHLSNSLRQTVAAIADLRAETERVGDVRAAFDAARGLARQVERPSTSIDAPAEDGAAAAPPADDGPPSGNGAAGPRAPSGPTPSARPR